MEKKLSDADKLKQYFIIIKQLQMVKEDVFTMMKLGNEVKPHGIARVLRCMKPTIIEIDPELDDFLNKKIKEYILNPNHKTTPPYIMYMDYIIVKLQLKYEYDLDTIIKRIEEGNIQAIPKSK